MGALNEHINCEEVAIRVYNVAMATMEGQVLVPVRALRTSVAWPMHIRVFTQNTKYLSSLTMYCRVSIYVGHQFCYLLIL